MDEERREKGVETGEEEREVGEAGEMDLSFLI